MNPFEFKQSLTVSKFRKTATLNDYEFDINGETYYIVQWKAGVWSAYDEATNEYYADNTTRKSVVADIIYGLWYTQFHNL